MREFYANKRQECVYLYMEKRPIRNYLGLLSQPEERRQNGHITIRKSRTDCPRPARGFVCRTAFDRLRGNIR